MVRLSGWNGITANKKWGFWISWYGAKQRFLIWSNRTTGNTAGSNLLRAISNLLPEYSGAETTRKVQPSLAHPSSARIFQISADLNDTAVLERLVDAYFTCYNSSYPIIHEATFRKRCQSGQDIHARSNWQLIFYLVLAIGDWILDGESNAEQSRYYTAARSRMLMQMLESGNLLNVQAFLLMVSPVNNGSVSYSS